MITTILFLFVLSVLVFVHELGHFLASKLFKIRVDEFAIGFPPKIFSWKKGETTYALNALPLGGYVKIHGENPEDATDPTDKRNFQNVSWWKQVVVLAAGVTFNIIFAWLLLSLSLMVGTTKASLEGIDPAYVSGPQKVLIQAVTPDSPAAKADIQPGDVVLSVNGKEVTTSVQVQTLVKESKKKVLVETERKDATSSHEVIFANESLMGVTLAEVATIKMPFFPALKHGAAGTWYLTSELTNGVLGFFGKLFVGHASWEEVSGPVGIAKHVGSAGREGFASLIFISVLISISLAIMNILPFPALDGGRIVISVIEGIMRKRLNPTFVNVLNTIGFGLLLLLMLVVTIKDIF
ncbi:MAG: hypothetical protein RJB39_116 [Candidatus Parcubacteria bacterium]|jgi:regulator of sigma E protease